MSGTSTSKSIDMVFYSGVVQGGAKRGTALGYPTVNIPLTDSKISGIFAAKVTAKGTSYFAAAFADSGRGVLEAYILDFSDDVYGQEVSIELIQKIRESKAFSGDTDLRAAIEEDVAKVREYFTKS